MSPAVPPRPAVQRSRPDLRWTYYRRRAVVLGLPLLALWSLTRACSGGSATPRVEGVDAAGPGITTTTTAPPCPPGGRSFATTEDEPVPAALRAAVDAQLAQYPFTIHTLGASIWVDGYGEIVDEGADLPLAPASNQKLFTAMGALQVLDPASTLDTTVLAARAPDEGGVLDGDLYLVGGGDPLLKRQGPHSIEDIAARLADAGLRRVTGSVVGDETRYDQVRKAPGWLSWEMPIPGGSMSALMVNSNSRIGDQAYLENPTTHNAELLATALRDAGVEVDGSGAAGVAPDDAELLLTYRSPPIGEIVQVMLRESDNMAAELLAKEIGLQVSGEGTTAAGLAAIDTILEEALCLRLEGVNDDASGISRDNRRSTREWAHLLLAGRDAPWSDVLVGGLPIAGEEGTTLATRFLGSEAAGDVRAKTGQIGTAVALSGYLDTDGGREVVFSIVVNGDQPLSAVDAIDRLVIAVAADGT